MSDEAEEVIEQVAEAPVEAAPEPSDDLVEGVVGERSEADQAGDVYDRLMGERDRDESGRFVAKNKEDEEGVEPVVLEEPEKDEKPVEAKAEDEAPSILPRAVKEKWKDLPADVREAFASSQKEMGDRLAVMQRRDQAISPIADMVTKAAQQFPELSGQTPQAIAQDVMELATTRVQLQRDPVNTLLQVASSLGALPELAAYFGKSAGMKNSNGSEMQLQQRINQLEQQLQSVGNPDNISQIVSQQFETRAINEQVKSFAAGKEHWDKVEAALPQFIPAVRAAAGDNASNEDVLSKAYDMAVSAYGLKASAPIPEKALVKPDPRRTEAVIRANSTNVNSRASKASPLSERDEMSAVYDRLMSG